MGHRPLVLTFLVVIGFVKHGLCTDKRQESLLPSRSLSCTTDTYLRLLESDLPDADPFCRSFIGLDYTVTSLDTAPCDIATARQKVQVAIPAVTQHPLHDLERKLVEAQPLNHKHPRHTPLVPRGNDPQLASDISSACTCLGLTPDTTTTVISSSCLATAPTFAPSTEARRSRSTKRVKTSSTRSASHTSTPSPSQPKSGSERTTASLITPSETKTSGRSVSKTITGSVLPTKSTRRRRSSTSTKVVLSPTAGSTSSHKVSSSTRSKPTTKRTRPRSSQVSTSNGSVSPTQSSKTSLSSADREVVTSTTPITTGSVSTTPSTRSAPTSLTSNARSRPSRTRRSTSSTETKSSVKPSSSSSRSKTKVRSSRSSSQTRSAVRTSSTASSSPSRSPGVTGSSRTSPATSSSGSSRSPATPSTSRGSEGRSTSAATTTKSTTAISGSSPVCSQTQVVSNPSFETHNGMESDGWTITQARGDMIAMNAPNGHSGERHMRVRSNSTGGLIVLSQQVPLCPNTRYTFSAWTRRIFPVNRCQATFTFGNYPVALTNLLDNNSVYEQITGMFGPVSRTQVMLHISVTCSGSAGPDGLFRLALDDITLSKAA